MSDMLKQMKRGGMIGAGAWSTKQLAAWAEVEGAEIVALCDRQPQKLERVSTNFDIQQTFTNAEEMMERADIDFVDICTRPSSHAHLTRLAATRHLSVLCQKPFCTSLEEAQNVVKFCLKAEVPLMVNENHRWQNWFRDTKELLDSGVLGTPFLARIQIRSRLSLPEFNHPQVYLAEMPRLIVYEAGVHYLDTFRYLFGEPERVFAKFRHVSPLMKGEDLAAIILEYEELIGEITMSWASVPIIDPTWSLEDRHPAPRLEIDGTKGTLILKGNGSLHLHLENDYRTWQGLQNVREQSRIATQEHFIQCLESGMEFETSGFETIKTMALVYACYLSAEEGRFVNMEELLM
jgi:predicted dehydrogenase